VVLYLFNMPQTIIAGIAPDRLAPSWCLSPRFTLPRISRPLRLLKNTAAGQRRRRRTAR